jgi:nucleotide-binding universal stress UspA family protein
MKILIATDTSENALFVIEHGLDRAARMGADEIHFVTSVGETHEMSPSVDWLEDTTRELCDVFDCTNATATFHVVREMVPIAISNLVKEIRPDLLVIGRFGVPSHADVILETIDVPTLVVGPDGPDLEPQCPDCGRIRKWTNAQRLFCEKHAGDHTVDSTRLPPSSYVAGAGMW